MQQVNDLKYAPLANNRDYAATVVCASATDLNWTVQTQGSVDGQPQNIQPSYVIVDNYQNPATAVISYGAFSFSVAAYQRTKFGLAGTVQNVVLEMLNNNAAPGTCRLIFVTDPNFVPDDANLLAIQEAARGASLFPYIVYNAANNFQLNTDNTSVVEFAANVNATYQLLQVAPNIADGWFTFLFNNGSKLVAITPFGGDSLNSIFNNATPFNFYPGEWATLSSDGTQWFLKVLGQKNPSVTYTASVITQTPNDLNKRLQFATGLGQNYDLLPAATFANGDKLRVKCVSGTALAVTPSGLDQINGTFTNAAPLYLEPGDEIELFINDAGVWQADGRITFVSSLQNFNAGVNGSITHSMGGQPDDCKAWVKCIGAEINYNVGDIFQLGLGTASSTNPGGEHVVAPSPTVIWWCIAANAGIRLPNKTTGVSSNVAQTSGSQLTNFQLYFTATRRL